jgi:hypothetical protein
VTKLKYRTDCEHDGGGQNPLREPRDDILALPKVAQFREWLIDQARNFPAPEGAGAIS